MSKNSTDYDTFPRISFASQYLIWVRQPIWASSNSVNFSQMDEIVVMTNPDATEVPLGYDTINKQGVLVYLLDINYS